MSDSPSTAALDLDRRATKRRTLLPKLRIECRRGLMGLGPNLALGLGDVSQTGARITTSRRLATFDEVELILSSTTWTKPIKVQGMVVRVLQEDDDRQSIGVRFFKPLSYHDISNLT